jgi:hypothetical protein
MSNISTPMLDGRRATADASYSYASPDDCKFHKERAVKAWSGGEACQYKFLLRNLNTDRIQFVFHILY